ncbi:uncharacterized protein LOC143185933 [Calliopsis andreniformis]|uniref:uncharacterized protein LOC143185933 n=1 Tax=Calliopsis andreniformis TaxID=337506 RepID=UPI003FCEC1F1
MSQKFALAALVYSSWLPLSRFPRHTSTADNGLTKSSWLAERLSSRGKWTQLFAADRSRGTFSLHVSLFLRPSIKNRVTLPRQNLSPCAKQFHKVSPSQVIATDAAAITIVQLCKHFRRSRFLLCLGNS